MLVDVSLVDLATSVLGQRIELPILLAPVALQRLAHAGAEVASARAAAAAGTIMALSTMASATIEEVARAADGPKWFQFYVHPDREVSRHLVQRAEAAPATAPSASPSTSRASAPASATSATAWSSRRRSPA